VFIGRAQPKLTSEQLTTVSACKTKTSMRRVLVLHVGSPLQRCPRPPGCTEERTRDGKRV